MFTNRRQAALLLGKALWQYKGAGTVVLGIPCGGLETAYYVAEQLKAGLGFIIVRKLAYPDSPEYAFGAMAEDGTVCYNARLQIRLSQEMIDAVEDRQLKEIERRKRIFREFQPFPNLKKRTVIIADDGIATGATVMAAIKVCKRKGAATIIAAAPVISPAAESDLRHEANEVVFLEKPADFRSVSQVYESFHDITEQQALKYIEKWQQKTMAG